MKSLTPQQINQKKYFDQHTKVDTLHFTSDGQCFFNLNDAENHAKHLEFHKNGKRDVETLTRAQVEAWGTAKAEAGDKPAKTKLVKSETAGTGEGVQAEGQKQDAIVADEQANTNEEDIRADEQTEEDVPPYEEWTKKELIDECKVRDIELTGKETKAMLVELLEANDETTE